MKYKMKAANFLKSIQHFVQSRILPKSVYKIVYEIIHKKQERDSFEKKAEKVIYCIGFMPY